MLRRVRAPPAFRRVAHAHRHQRAHRRRRAQRLGAGQQPAAQRAGDHGQHDVVDRPAERVAHPAVVGQPVRAIGEPALLAQPRPQRRGRPGGAAGAVAAYAAPAGERRRARDGGHARRARPPRTVLVDAERAARRARRARRAPGRASSGSGPGIQIVLDGAPRRRRGVEDHLGEIDPVLLVDHRLVGLGHDRDPALGQALDEVHLPQRAGAVEQPRLDPARRTRAAARRCPGGAAPSGARGR